MTPPGTPPCSPEVSAPQPLLKHAQHKGQAPNPSKDSYSLQKALISETLDSQVSSEGWQIEQAKFAGRHTPRRGQVFCILKEGAGLPLSHTVYSSHRSAQAGEEIPGQFRSLVPNHLKTHQVHMRTELAESVSPLCPASSTLAASSSRSGSCPCPPTPPSPAQCNASVCAQQQHRILQRRNH